MTLSMRNRGVFGAAALLAVCGGAFGQVSGPSTSHTSYMLPSSPTSGVVFTSLISNGNGSGGLAQQVYGRINANNQFVAGSGGTVGNGYQMAGIPDGMGAYDNGDGTYTILMNHEIGANAGVQRAHGSRGAFVSTWVVRNDGTVIGGRDSASDYNLWNIGSNSYQNFNASNPMPQYNPNATNGVQGWVTNNPNRDGIGRYCSGDLAAQSAYQWTDTSSGITYGTSNRVYLAGEEIGSEGRLFAHVGSTATQLPAFGKMSWENAVTNPFAQRATVTIGLDDSTPGNIFVYVGQKQDSGSDVERAGLTNGKLFTVTMNGTTTGPVSGTPNANIEDRTNVYGTAGSPSSSKAFSLYEFGQNGTVSVPSLPGSTITPTGGTAVTGLQQRGDTNGQMNFLRPEDGAWDPRDPSKFYFLTTDAFGGNSRIHQMQFNNITDPSLGGTLTVLGDGKNTSSFSGGFTSFDSPDRSTSVSITGKANTMEMADNMCAVVGDDNVTRLLIQEDVGNNARLGRLWLYDTSADSLLEIGISDVRYFGYAGTAAGGLIPAGIAGAGTNAAAAIPGWAGATNSVTLDEETSGIIPAPWLGKGWFLLNMQAHYSIGGELVEGGQVMAVYIPQTIPAPAAAAILGLGGLVATRRRRA